MALLHNFSYNPLSKFSLSTGCLTFALVILIMSGSLFMYFYNNTITNDYTVIITNKHQEGTKDKFWIIETKNNKGNKFEFSNEDSLVDAKFDSAAMLITLEIGKTYHIYTRGMRIKLLSMYPNITSATLVQQSK